MTKPLYAIGDIHGQYGMLMTALDRIERDGGGRVVFLGDYVDRGPASREVIEALAQGLAEGQDWICLKGNHDRFFDWFMERPKPRQDPHLLIGYHWFHEAIGGRETLASYGLELPERIRLTELAELAHDVVPEHHITFLRNLRTHHREAGKYFVHAGIRPGVPLDGQAEDDQLWIRQEFHRDDSDHGALIVHGHTPVKAPDLRRNRLNLDTGAGYGDPLTVAVFEGEDVFALDASGRRLLRPVF